MKKYIMLVVLLTPLVLGGCQGLDPAGNRSPTRNVRPSPERLQQQTQRIKSGMSKDQVVAILGKPHRITNINGKELWFYNKTNDVEQGIYGLGVATATLIAGPIGGLATIGYVESVGEKQNATAVIVFYPNGRVKKANCIYSRTPMARPLSL
jgi:hypothetical protein